MPKPKLENNISLNFIADKIVRETSDVMRYAKSEEDLKIGFEKILAIYLKQLDIKVRPKYEKTIYDIGKRSDALHGQVIIEYEKPKAFNSQNWIDHAFEQLVDYIIGEAEDNNEELFLFNPKYVGVGFDGQKIFFVQYFGDKEKPKTKFNKEDFKISGIYDFNEESVRTLLTYFRALAKQLLTAENLAATFGTNSKLAPLVVSSLVDALKNWNENPKINVFYNEWKRLFGIVYGEQLNNEKNAELNSLKLIYNISEDVNFKELLFCIHTYFALLMKLIAADLLELKESTLTSIFSDKLVHLDRNDFELALIDIEDGGIYAKKGITNFLEGDFFRWYLSAFSSPRLYEALSEMVRELSGFEPATSLITPEATKDLLKKLYQYLVPRDVRHNLGEYYTPDWLAELTINEIEFDGDITKRLLDPSCGSGTFIVILIQRVRQYALSKKLSKKETVSKIIQNIWGFDLNPLAIIASRTNYLFALGDLLDELDNVEIPIFLCDSVLWPEKQTMQLELAASGEQLQMQTSVGVFNIPKFWIKDAGKIMRIAAPLIETLVKENYEADIAIEHLRIAGCVESTHENIVGYFYNQILELERDGKNGIWARFLKNVFAPMIAGKFDFIIGNPPWIRWDYLSADYRNITKPLWVNYGLFSLKGFASRLGGGKKDFSMLFVYATSDYFLKDGGKLGFLITQEVLKSKGAGEGFRRFWFTSGTKKMFLNIIKAHDFVSLQPFEGAVNKTAAIFLVKGEETIYPVPYYVWKKVKGKISPDKSLNEVLPFLTKTKLSASPIGNSVGSWQTSSGDNNFSEIEGPNNYTAHSGAYISPYGVFWVKIENVLNNNRVNISNITDKGKTKIDKVNANIESDLLFPGLRGSDIKRWGAKSQINVILSQDPKTRSPYEEKDMKKRWPLTYNYLVKFKDILANRASKVIKNLAANTSFYAVFGVGEYTMTNYKVVWIRMTNDLIAAVISQENTAYGWKTIIPFETTTIISTNKEEEAHYLCAVINSIPVREFVKSFSSAGRGFGTSSIMQHIGIPKFDEANNIHLELCKLSKLLHSLKEKELDFEITVNESKITPLVMQLFKK